jgi:ABC-type Fe3+ transport system permease subunit
MGLSRIKKLALVVGTVVAPLCAVAIAVSLWKEWQGGTAFDRYRNWDHQWTSHGETVIVGAVVILVLILSALWSWRERWREKRLLEKMASRWRAG